MNMGKGLYISQFSHSVVSDSLRLHGLKPARLFCPCDFSGKNTGVGCHALLQGISLTQGSNPCLTIPLVHTCPLF